MTNRKEKTEPEEINEPHSEAVETPESVEQALAEIEDLKNRLEEAEAKASENLSGWQRAQAEFVNYKNRMLRDQETMRSLMKGDILKKILPVLDDLERALSNRPAEDAWADGMELITRKFQSIIESEGLTRIQAEGQPFDPNFHEAISHEASEGVESGHVIAVVQNGYMLGDRVIRPAMVRVAQ
jgi:molecular chaperone GrpE